MLLSSRRTQRPYFSFIVMEDLWVDFTSIPYFPADHFYKSETVYLARFHAEKMNIHAAVGLTEVAADYFEKYRDIVDKTRLSLMRPDEHWRHSRHDQENFWEISADTAFEKKLVVSFGNSAYLTMPDGSLQCLSDFEILSYEESRLCIGDTTYLFHKKSVT